MLFITVPFGKHAFFPGELRHTNELQVHLGGQYRVECTAPHAAGVLERRLAAIDADIALVEADIKGLQDRLLLSGRELRPQDVAVAGMGREGGRGGEEALFEIRESYEESEALMRSAATPRAPQRGADTPGQERASPRGRGGGGDDDEFDRIFARIADLELLESQQQVYTQDDQLSVRDRLGDGSRLKAVKKTPMADGVGANGSSGIQALFSHVPLRGPDHALLPEVAAGIPRPSEQCRPQHLPLKKGFFGSSPASKPKAPNNPPSPAASTWSEGALGNRTTAGMVFSSTSNTVPGSSSCTGAFSGQVVERGAAAVPGDSDGAPDAHKTTGSVDDLERKVSKFKLQRAGK